VCNFRVGKVEGLYKLRSVEPLPDQGSKNGCNMVSNSSDVVLPAVFQGVWHQHLWHVSPKSILLLKDLAHVIAFEEKAQIPVCIPCVGVKMKTFPKGSSM
jgi:hypothetical protein